MFPIIIAFEAMVPTSLRDRKSIKPIVNRQNPPHCVTESTANPLRWLENVKVS